MSLATTLIAQGTEPAGGAATGEIMIATGAATVVTIALMVPGHGPPLRPRRAAGLRRPHRHPRHRPAGLGRASRSGLATVSLITAVIGMYWDIALHIGVGRDEGPLANPAHYFILAGLFGIFSAGFFAIVMPKDDPGPTAIRIGRDWHAPLGGVLICACGAFSLIGFPLDDVWHRLFGQDVTLWGPTHLMLIGGAAMTLVGHRRRCWWRARARWAPAASRSVADRAAVRRPDAGPRDLPGRVRLRRAPVPVRLPARS